MFENILLAVDGSKHALKTATLAGELARSMNSKSIRVVVVYSAIPIYLGEPNLQSAIDARLDDANKILKDAVAEVGDIPGEIHSELLEGSPAEVIVDVAETRKVDLIMVGSRGSGTFTNLMLGSTCQNVVNHAPCPVLVVR